MPTIRNIIIFVGIGAAFVLIYIFFIKPSVPEENLVSSPVSSSPGTVPSNTATASENNPVISKDLLSLLLSVQSIELKVSLFADTAFLSLHDSSIPLNPDGNEGRVNPFAPLGSDPVIPAGE